MLTLHTARLGYAGADALDVALQSNLRRVEAGEVGGHRGVGILFAPSPGLLYPYLTKRRHGTLTAADWTRYREAYENEMRAIYRRSRAPFDAVLAMGEVTLLCYCTDPTRCHRTVLAEVFAKLGADVRGERAT